ncbi:beta-carotene 15,15'-monooxygenase [Sphingobacterium alkalisoli]|uniref:Beta-carotene 15,15'-monooxygenase n=1 Tax=Sphingobacterium alkalisoli TaxID=1874115 RepID=A0A4U0H6I1_9SPHI|nr:beta-carotene 15,15'-monooxygenase [Sphingobacterium alkalisoli]TJY65952.1 beta-carotene 15,15'-monooxygenase [Sphingobacterium alkalisoli]GGH17254.1 hypothetical protein GCM10011418_20070 [Sphingobacterium alkalisoli]
MIQFLKESTFAVNEVFFKSLKLLKSHYFSVAGLCLLLFITSNASTTLAEYLRHYNVFVSALFALVFTVIYFGVNLTLFKYVMLIFDGKKELKLSSAIPTTKDLSFFFGAMLIIVIISLTLLVLMAVICWPFIYVGGDIGVVSSIAVFISFVLTAIFIIRVAFYPFFIIDRHCNSFQSIRLSFAMTRGNVTKLILIILTFGLLHVAQAFANFSGNLYLGVFISIVNSFLIVPLSSIVVTVAYRDMMSTYQGGDNPEYLKNII